MNAMTASPPADILVIEDDPDARDNLRDILELDEHRVTTVGSAAEALEQVGAGRFSAIILDRRLPDGTAEQLMPKLNALGSDAAVIVVTGYSDLQGAIAALRQGATDYILKPLNLDVLREPGTGIRAEAFSSGEGTERDRISSPRRGRRMHDRHPADGSYDCLLQPIRRAAHRLLGRRGSWPRLPSAVASPISAAPSPTSFCA